MPVTRRLAALLSADAVGYSRLMAQDESATVRLLAECRSRIAQKVGQFAGRVVDATGDNLLAELPSAADAVACALEIQRELSVLNAEFRPSDRMPFRIGVNVGDVLVDGERIYGSGVNVAARLEALAEPGSVCISGVVRDQLSGKLDVHLDDLGLQSVKNIPEPVRAFRVRPASSRRVEVPSGSARRTGLVAAGALLAMAAIVLLSWPRPLGWVVDAMGASAPPVNPPLPNKPSVVVLPFVNMSSDPEQVYFADGITEDLTTELSRNEGLFVIARNSAFTYKGRAVKVEDVARELGVRYVLEGSVRRAGDRVRITAQLIDAHTGFHLWSERYDRRLSDIFALQDEMAHEIQKAMQGEIRDAEIARVRRNATENVEAYDAMLRGMFHFERLRRDDLMEARRWFSRALELDPDYSAALAMHGSTYALEYNMGWNRDPALLQAAEESARRALEMGTHAESAFTTLGNVSFARRQLDEAASYYERGMALEPSHDIPPLMRGMVLAAQGRFLPALSSIHRALRLNPRGTEAQRLILSFVNYRAGRVDQAVRSMETIREESPDAILPRLMLIVHRDAEGRSDEAQALVEEILHVNPDLTAADANRMTIAFDVEAAFQRAGLP